MDSLLQKMKTGFFSQKTRPLVFRKKQLEALDRLLVNHESAFFAALALDLGKSAFESYVTEVGFIRAEIKQVFKNLNRWSKKKTFFTPLIHQPGKSYVVPEPLGVILIIGPWNYPVQLILGPLIGAISAGNCAILKPSELSTHTSALIAKLLPQYLDPDCFAVVEGDAQATQALLKQKFDHIFFTGSSSVGRSVMQAASLNLTPVTLELGGKNPCIIDDDVDLALCAKRIAWGKFLNAGQTCIAPDYVLVHRKIKTAFLKEMQKTIQDFYGQDPKTSKNFGRIISDKHLQRLSNLLEENTVFSGGEIDGSQKYISPTIVVDIDENSRLMQEEIFGPILPVLEIQNIQEAAIFINKREKPLALYLFSNNVENQNTILRCTSSGGVSINDTISHVAIPDLPFGGIGTSGMGSYHGYNSFKTFSHLKPVFAKSTFIDIPVRYPPYGKNKLKIARQFL
jgi:aldehyde dehydrogenase (NAD+)